MLISNTCFLIHVQFSVGESGRIVQFKSNERKIAVFTRIRINPYPIL
jgi:hypothetical protein